MDAITTKARAELRSITIKIQELTEQKSALEVRKAALETFLGVYSDLVSGEDSQSIIPAPAQVPVKTRVITLAMELLSDGRHMHTRDILAEVQKMGVEVGGQDPIQALSAILSQDSGKRFQANRKMGWSLKGKAPGPVPAGPGIDSNAAGEADPTSDGD